MFRFNLLPPERRRLKRTPLPYLIAIIAFTIIFAYGVVDLLFTLQNYKLLRDNQKNLTTQLNKLKEAEAKYNELSDKKNKLENRLQFIKQVEAKKYILWAKEIDEFLDILQKFPKAWIEDMSISTGGGEEIPEFKGRKILSTFEIRMVMHSDNPADIVNFREAIKNPQNKLITAFDYIDPAPQWSMELFTPPEGNPIRVFKFVIRLIKFRPAQ
jgi:hypothetical protein